MAKVKKDETGAVQAAQSQPADAEAKVKADSDLSQSQSADDGAQAKADPDPSQSQSADDEAQVKVDPDPSQSQSADDKAQVKVDPDPSQSRTQEDEAQGNLEPQQDQLPAFMIICRNKINKMIGGVSFVNGVGYTRDGFTASWFGNKEGYEVRNTGL